MNLKPDEYNVVAVAKDGYYAGTWRNVASFKTMSDAYGCADSLSRERFRMAGVQPQASEMKPFYTHPITVLWEEQ